MKHKKTIIIENVKVKNFKSLIDQTIDQIILDSYNFKHNVFDKIKSFNKLSYLSLLQEDLIYYIDIYKSNDNYEIIYRNNFEYKLIKSLINEI